MALRGSFMWNRAAAALYGVALLVTGSVLYGQWIYAVRNGLLVENAPREIVKATGKRIRNGLGSYVIALEGS